MAVHFFMLQFLWASDVHLDHVSAKARAALAQQLRAADRAVLILTGDVSFASRLIADLEFLADAAARPLYLVLGNHDHYGASVAGVRDAVIELNNRRGDIQWLPPAGVVQLDEVTALIGVDGWADGRHGDPLDTPLILNDDRLIGEIAAQSGRSAKLAIKRVLADADAARLTVLLERAVAAVHTIIVATHVPPFIEALPTTGRLAHPDWLPLLVSGATGTVLRQFAARHPDKTFTVLCGHTHAATDVMVMPNLRCRVMGARYGEPKVVALSGGKG